MAVPWYTSQTLVQAIERKISLPLSQNTFSSQDLLAFSNEELMISLVPSILTYHEEYFVVHKSYPLVPNQLYYPIPDRAIGMRIRDLFYLDVNGNRFDMARINLDDKGYFQYNDGGSDYIFRYFLEGNNIVLTPFSLPTPTGSLEISYYLRPNQLVDDSNAATITNFLQTITVDNTTIADGDVVEILNGSSGIVLGTFTATSGSPLANQFLIGATSVDTATNLVSVINTAGIVLNISNVNSTSAVITLTFNSSQLEISPTNAIGFVVPSTIGIAFDSIPSNFSINSLVDLLQTKPGHQSLAISIPLLSISGNVGMFNSSDIVNTITQGIVLVGDYMCLENECIIPQIPPDLHVGLAERACARILAAIGDQAGLQASQAKIQQIENAQSPLLGARVDGDGKKVNARKSLLRYGKFINYRRF